MNNITDTGIRGYLRWLQQDQPALYKAAAPLIAQRVPWAFSDHEQSRALGMLTDTTGEAVPGVTTTFDPVTDGFDSASVVTQPSATTDVSAAANTGAASPSVVGDIGNIVNTLAQAYLTKEKMDAYQQVNNAQLQRAAAGGTPAQIRSTSVGVPLIAGFGGSLPSLSGLGPVVPWIVGGAAVLWFLGRRARA